MSNLRVDPLTPNIGAEITGVDLSGPLDHAVLEEIYQNLIEHQVIFFRDQDLSPQAHIDFAGAFGDLDRPHQVYPHVEGHKEIVLLENDEQRPPDTDCWHTDLTYYDDPPFASILRAKQVPATGGDTMWASMYAAYEGLSVSVQEEMSDLHAVHDLGSFRNNFIGEDGTAPDLNEAVQRMGCAVHPVVKRHPVSGRPFLYVNQGFTTHIAGLSTPASNRLLAYLFDHIDRPEYQVRFRWRVNSVAMWDNRVTQHYALSDYLPNYRCMHRVTVVNDRRAVGG